MSCKMIHYAIDGQHSDIKKGYKKGYAVCALDGSHVFTGDDLNNMVCINIPDAEKSEIETYIQPWKRETLYTILDFEPTADFFRVLIYPKPLSIGADGRGALTVAEMSAFLLKWGAEIIDVPGEIVFEITAMDALNKGSGYLNFGTDEEWIDIEEQDYNAATGNHECVLDYSRACVLTGEMIERALTDKQCFIVSHNVETRRIIFACNRSIMIGYLEQQVRSNFDTQLAKSLYTLPESIINQTFALENKTVQMLKADYLSSLIDVREVL